MKDWDERWFRNDLGGKFHGFVEILYRHLPDGTE
jgi:hypothetical protein